MGHKFKWLPVLLLTVLAAPASLTAQKADSSDAFPSEKEPQNRPNILFIMSDDHAYQAISAYDDRLIQTPNIDRIGEEGMRFTNACVANSICAPSRATILTGKHSHLNGKIDNRFPFDTTNVTFPQLFQEAGYQTAMYGKLHFGNNPKGVDDFMILPGQGNYINPDFITREGDTSITGYATDIITDNTLHWLKEKRDPDRPFMMMYLHKAPHRPWWPRPDKFAEFSQKTFPEPPTLFDDYSNRGTAAKTAEMNLLEHMRYSHDSKIRPATLEAMGEISPDVPPYDWGWSGPYDTRVNAEQRALYKPVLDSINDWFQANWPKLSEREKMQWKYQRYMQDYLACISSVDDNVGRVLDYLEESGLAENTIVIYTSDQGFYLGEHGWYDKRFIYDESFKTPLLVKWPGVTNPGEVNTKMVQNLDFAPTLLDACDIEIPEDMQGESLVPLLQGNDEDFTREAVYYHYYEYPAVHMVKRHYGIVTESYKLVHFYYDVDEWELYDRKKDPLELRNEINNPQYAGVIDRLRRELAELRQFYGDSDALNQRYIDLYQEDSGG
ncbi:Arylsulfatase A [Robiginitalea myxolifaciens]|uniref:Arylsulfatase A n=1 Tax=Robiginitalea myxolifaciens TaxID=400055 RepID=A0A1I6FW19_9FLAO|nr:sulfatase [Robiginitalea myxolifaciens]SFR34076.1 Arylsulfatase A [Robiginitalea myxolifaciens]